MSNVVKLPVRRRLTADDDWWLVNVPPLVALAKHRRLAIGCVIMSKE